MPNKTLSKIHRRAAGQVLMLGFSVNNSICHLLAHHVIRENSTGLTERELLLVQQLHQKYHERGEVMRRLGWRLLGKSSTTNVQELKRLKRKARRG